MTTNPIEYDIFSCNTISRAERCQHSFWGPFGCLCVCKRIKFCPSKMTKKPTVEQHHIISILLSSFRRQANISGQKHFGYIKWPINVILHHILIENRCRQYSLPQKKTRDHLFRLTDCYVRTNKKERHCLFEA